MNGYITLDYELGMGQSGTQENCLFEPMRHLTAMLDKYGVKTNLFVDTAYLLQLKKLKDQYPQLQKDYDAVIGHLRQLDSEGHALQLHLHPQWCYSNYDGKKWILDKKHFKLSDMSLEEQKQLIHEGAALLNSIGTRKVNAFRAGGFSVENFPELYGTFLAEGITVDSSVFRGERLKTQYHDYDYRKIPMKSSYQFYKDHKKEDPKGQMREYPLSTLVIDAFSYLWMKKAKHPEYAHLTVSKKKWGDAVGIGYPGGKLNVLKIKLKMLLGTKSICTYIEHDENIEKVYNYSTKKYEGDDFVIIGHPKCLTPYSIEILEIFIKNHPEISFKLF